MSDIRKRFGSNGFGFKERSELIKLANGIVMLNSFEVGSRVVTFFSKVSEQDYSKSKASESDWLVADHARLDAISIASSEYAQQEWGERVYDPGYTPVSWK